MPRVAVEPTTKQAELGGRTLRALQKEAERLKVDDAELDEAEDKAAVIALIEAARAAQAERELEAARAKAQRLEESEEAARTARLEAQRELKALQWELEDAQRQHAATVNALKV